MNARFHLLASIALAAAAMAGTAHAQVGEPGRLLASNCFQCHGTNGQGPGFDTIAGKSASEIYQELKDFQSGKEGDWNHGQAFHGLHRRPASIAGRVAGHPTLTIG